MKSSFHKGTDYFFRNIPAVTQEIGHHRGNWQFPCNVLHNVDFGNGFIVQNKSIIQDNAVVKTNVQSRKNLSKFRHLFYAVLSL